MAKLVAPFCLGLILFLALAAKANNQLAGPVLPDISCDGSPADAIRELPAPISHWGLLHCTPWGHVIEARPDWIWSRPAAYSPVWVPAQTVAGDPKPLGNQFYFSQITMTAVSGKEAQSATQAFSKMFPGDREPQQRWRLDLVPSSGQPLRLFFFDYGRGSLWGVWCNRECAMDSIFMLLDMSKRPG